MGKVGDRKNEILNFKSGNFEIPQGFFIFMLNHLRYDSD